MELEIFWYIVMIGAIAFYAVLDGFDLGVGSLHLLVKKDYERRVFLNAIGPVWDGNEVWLVVVMGALLAGFPDAYAAILSSFYLPMTGLIFGLIFRACAIEFRSKLSSLLWRKIWDLSFSIASLLISFLVGMTIGNFAAGIPLNEKHEFIGSTLRIFFQPYPFLVGGLVFSLFLLHGTLFLIMKTEGELQNKIKKFVTPTFIFFVTLYLVTTITTILYLPHMTARQVERPYLFSIAFLNLAAIVAIPILEKKGRVGSAFLSSCLNILLLSTLFAIGNFPYLIRSSINTAQNSLNVYNASSTPKTLMILSIIVAIGIPFVIGYFIYIYHVFRGKVKIDHHSY